MQVISVGRQMLSFFMGGGIDEYLMTQLRSLRTQHSIARIILSLQQSLWPCGVWYSYYNQRNNPFKPQYGANGAPKRSAPVTPAGFLTPSQSPPDEVEVALRVKDLLLS